MPGDATPVNQWRPCCRVSPHLSNLLLNACRMRPDSWQTQLTQTGTIHASWICSRCFEGIIYESKKVRLSQFELLLLLLPNCELMINLAALFTLDCASLTTVTSLLRFSMHTLLLIFMHYSCIWSRFHSGVFYQRGFIHQSSGDERMENLKPC